MDSAVTRLLPWEGWFRPTSSPLDDAEVASPVRKGTRGSWGKVRIVRDEHRSPRPALVTAESDLIKAWTPSPRVTCDMNDSG